MALQQQLLEEGVGAKPEQQQWIQSIARYSSIIRKRAASPRSVHAELVSRGREQS